MKHKTNHIEKWMNTSHEAFSPSLLPPPLDYVGRVRNGEGGGGGEEGRGMGGEEGGGEGVQLMQGGRGR